jgi:O-antigen/teichoic acid export membrane protein
MTDAATVGGRRAAADVLVQVVGRVANLALGLIVTLVLVRALGTTGFGQWSTIFAVTQIAAVFAELGLEQVTVARAAAEGARRDEWLSALLVLRLALAAPVALACVAVVLLLATSDAMRVAGVLVSGTLIVGAPTALRAAFQLRVRNDVTTLIVSVNSVLWAVAVILIAAGSGGLVAFATAFLAVAAVTSILSVVCALRWGGMQLTSPKPVWRELARVGMVAGAATILTTAYVRIDQVLVFQLAGARQAGLYGAAFRILDQIQFIPVAAMTTLMPIIAAAHRVDAKRAREMFRRSEDYLALVSLPALAFSIAAAEPIVRTLFGAQFAPAAPALPVLMAAFVVISASYPVDALIIVLGRQGRLAMIAAGALALNVALNLALVPSYGFEVAAWITLATELLVLPLTLRTVGWSTSTLLRGPRLWRIALAAAGMGLITFGLRAAGVSFLGLVAATATYPLLLAALRAVRIGELRDLLVRRAA